MKRTLPFILLIIFFAVACNSGKQALKLFSKQKYAAGQSKLDKALTKDSLNADLFYVYSLLYTDTAFIGYDIDSSFLYIKRALADYHSTDTKTKSKFQAKLGIDSLVLWQQKLLTDSLAYERASNAHTVPAYQRFLDEHPDALQVEEATQIRNQLDFHAATESDTYGSYKNFMDAYPGAEQYNLARDRYNTLLFREKTKEGTLLSYLNFLQAFPDSPFRPQAEEQILQITTASNDLDAYENFISQYPQSVHRRLAVNLLYHLYREKHSSEAFFRQYPKLPYPDSLKRAAKIDQKVLAPVFENQHYGLMDHTGKYLIATNYDLIPADYFCEGVSAQIVHLAVKEKNQAVHQVLTKSGELIYEYRLPLSTDEVSGSLNHQKIHEIGVGLLLIENEKGKYFLFHQSGYTLYPDTYETYPLDTAILINSIPTIGANHEYASYQFIKIQQDGLWGLISFTGRVLLEPVYDEIEAYGNFMAITKDGNIAVSNRTQLIEAANQNAPSLSFLYDDVALIDNQHIVAYTDGYETAIDQNLKIAVPLGRHNIIRMIDDNGPQDKKWLLRENRTEAYVRNDSLKNQQVATYYLYDKNSTSLPSMTYQKAYFNNYWVALQNKKGFHFFDFQKEQESQVYDSVKLIGENFALLFRRYPNAKDSVKVLFQNGGLLALASPEKLNFLLLKPTSTTIDKKQEYLLISPNNGPKEVWSQYGKRIIQGNFDNISIYPSGLFGVEQRGKRGLLDSLGNELVPNRYQGISNYDEGLLAIFQNKKFGAYRYSSKTLIEPKYDAVLQNYGQPVYHPKDSSYSELYVARKDGAYGIINRENTQLSDFAFDEISYWNDTSAFVRQNDEWMIYRFSRQEKFDKEQDYVLYDEINDYQLLEQTADETIIKIYKKSGYGILSNRRGEILSPTYDDIRVFGNAINTGSMYLSEKYVPEADLYIVIHLDYAGNIIKRQALTSEQYDKVFCEG
ncbi:WG repeat-containing protein [Catalinimonas niigatensis]|uniref:WG repeat-containing protein n=1 Tax=Catalinimonas niigatensis TaxID=1397264 RepID=UPI0026661BF7|nr:WG repeat-containing protein [Catalinimonas niigatensis]WPP52264.1 WG repeat-containing protein [Catalinimonas niigatensis]